MTNQQIADTLEKLADLLEFTGTNPFRLRAYRKAARTIRDSQESIARLVEQETELTQLDGIGKSVAEKCVVLVQTGTLPQLEELLEEIPKSVLDLLRIPKLGPKKAAALFNELGIVSLDQLQAACEAQKVRELDGFGEKTEQAILEGIEIASAAALRKYWSEADELVGLLRAHLQTCPEVGQLEFAGSYRRGKETVGDLDILVTSEEPDVVMDCLEAFPQVESIIGRGGTKLSLRIGDSFQVDLRVVPDESFGAALQYFTGSKEHNVVLRSMAKTRGLKINEWGVFRVEGDNETKVAGATESDVYAALDLPVFDPETRESRSEFDWAEQGALPQLIELRDLAGDLHMHTTASDGSASIEQMIEAARKQGLKYIAITDHSKRVTMANGLDGKRLLEQWAEVDRINAETEDFWVLKGVEVDILENGDMDIEDDVLAQADWVTASIHYGQSQPREKITERILGAIANPFVSAISHPTGRLLNQRKPYEVDMEAVMQAAKEHGKLLELNAHPARLDLHDIHCAMAKSHGIPIVINSDAHSTSGFNVLRFGVKQARRAGLTAADVANTQLWPELKAMIGKKS